MTRSKEEQVKLREEMQWIVDELNKLQDEASEKVGDVPKKYVLNSWGDDAMFWLMSVVSAIFFVTAVVSFMRALWRKDWFIIIVYVVVWFLVIYLVDSYRRRPYRVEEHVCNYWVNDTCLYLAAKELERVRAGIAKYDQQYEEQKEFIQKFDEYRLEIEDWGSLHFVLKASGFYAHLRIVTGMDDVDCRLKFNPDGYKRLTDTIEWFNQNA